jgi:hypothetical protein
VAKVIFDECGFDFYTQHPYAYEPHAMVKDMEVLQGKPLVFTEWGGWFIHNNPNLLAWFKKTIARYAHNRPPEPCLAGMCWWQWQDIFEFNRGLPGVMDGLLSDGLVDRHRKKKPMYDVMSALFRQVDSPPVPRARTMVTAPHRPAMPRDRYLPLDLSAIIDSPAQQDAWTRARELSPRHERTGLRQGITCTGPVLLEGITILGGMPVALRAGSPLVLAGECAAVEIAVGAKAAVLHAVGHTTYFDGWPARGAAGEVVARYRLVYAEGAPVEVPLRAGIEMASASMIVRHSRMDPVATAAERVLVLTIDPDFEIYQINRASIAADPSRMLERVVFESTNPGYCPLLYGITVELAAGDAASLRT